MARYKLVRTISTEDQERKEILNKGSLLYLAAKAFDFQRALQKERYEIEVDPNNELNFTAVLRDQEVDAEGDIIASVKYQISRLTKEDEVRPSPKFDPKRVRTPKPSKAEEKRKAKKEKKATRLQVTQVGKTVNGEEKSFTNNPLLFEGGPEEVSSFCESYCKRMADSGADISLGKNGFVVTRQIASGELKLAYEIKAA